MKINGVCGQKHKYKFKNHRTHAERQQNEREANEMHSRIDKIPFHLARERTQEFKYSKMELVGVRATKLAPTEKLIKYF